MDNTPITIAVPDSGPLITLCKLNMLGLLLSFKDEVNIVITDIVHIEVTQNSSFSKEAQSILDFCLSDRVSIEDTTFGEMFKTIRKTNKDYPLPDNIGELSIHSYIAAQKSGKLPGDPTMVLFEDKWFLNNRMSMGNVHLTSTSAFIRGLYENNFITKNMYDEATNYLYASNRADKQIEDPANKIQPTTSWKASLDTNKSAEIKKSIERFRSNVEQATSKNEHSIKPK